MTLPGFLRLRKRSLFSRILRHLPMFTLFPYTTLFRSNRSTGNTVAVTDWTNYLKKGTALYNTGNSLLGSSYRTQTVDTIPREPTTDYNVLSDVASTGFWSPYGP